MFIGNVYFVNVCIVTSTVLSSETPFKIDMLLAYAMYPPLLLLCLQVHVQEQLEA